MSEDSSFFTGISRSICASGVCETTVCWAVDLIAGEAATKPWFGLESWDGGVWRRRTVCEDEMKRNVIG